WVWDTSTWGGRGEGYGTVPVGEGIWGSGMGKIYSEVHLGEKRGYRVVRPGKGFRV
nr:hypothetical protein [Tanacetum cinerariifolium]